MTTLASPSHASTHLSMWRVEMPAGGTGPLHRFDSEQIWTVIEGRITIDVEGESTELAQGDMAVTPPDLERQVAALEDMTLIGCDLGRAFASVPGEDAPRGTPAWNA